MAKSFLNMSGYPLGLRNNNPGNIRPGDNWQGMIGENQGFVVFENIAWGLRAMGKAIIHEFNVGNNTIAKLISDWAPPSENDTEAYIRNMVKYTGFSADQALPADRATLKKLIRAHMNVELGLMYSSMITDADIDEGLALMKPELLDYFKQNPASIAGLVIAAAIGVAVWFYRK